MCSFVVWTFVSVVWDNPAWKPKAEVLCGFQYKIWELVGRLYHPQGQTTLNHTDVYQMFYQMLYHCLFIVSCFNLSFIALNLAFMLNLSFVAYSLLLPKEHILELFV